MVYYISNELSHHGVKGMRWGIRKQRVSSGTGRRGNSSSSTSSSGRKKMSTAKKVAIGAACVAAVAGVSYIAITRGHNKSAMAGKKYAMRVMRKYSKDKIKRGPIGTYFERRDNGTGVPYVATIKKTQKLTGHSGRVTRLGAARHRAQFHTNKARQSSITGDYMKGTSSRAVHEQTAYKSGQEIAELYKNSNNVKIYTTRPMNKLKRQKGPRVLRYK